MTGTDGVDLLLSRLHRVRSVGDGKWGASCPAPGHGKGRGDVNPSLSISSGNGRGLLIKCFAGCETEAVLKSVGLDWQDILPPREHSVCKAAHVNESRPITVADLAADKALPMEFLTSLGWEDRPGGVIIPYRKEDDALASRQRFRTALVARAGSKWLGRKEDGEVVPYGLNRLEEARERGFLILVEGETDAATLWLHGYPALGIPGADMTGKLQPEHVAGLDRVFYYREPDQGGETFATNVPVRLREIGFAGEVREVKIHGVTDANELHKRDPAGFDAAFGKAIDEARKVETVEDRAEDPVPLFTQRMADIEIKPIAWLWRDRLPLGKLVVIAGEPGLGKSRLALSVAATTSKGGSWPGGEGRCERGEVLILNFEDDPADTTAPRLTAEGADLSAIHQLIAVPDEKGRRAFDLSRDTDRLAKYLELHPLMRLVIVDPITACMGRTDSHKNAEVRAALHPLGEVAQRYGVCVLAITHLNKGTGMKAMHRVTGSIAFTAAARVVFAVAKDETDPEGRRRLFVPVKNNLGDDRTGFSFGTQVVPISPLIEAPRIVWGDRVTTTADEALAPPPSEAEQGALYEAREFLNTLLADGPVSAEKVKREARSAGIASTTLKRAKRALKAKATKTGMRGGWEWSLR